MKICKKILVYGKHTINTPDKYGEIVALEGMDFSHFWLNPVIVYGTLETVAGHVRKMENGEAGLWVTDMDIIDDAIGLAVERGDLVPVLTFQTKKYETVMDVPIHTTTELLALYLVPKDRAVR